MDPWEKNLAAVLFIDLATRAPVRSAELALSFDDAEVILGRSPDVRSEDLVAWGNVSASEFRELAHYENNFDAEHTEQLVAIGASESVVISIFWGETRGERRAATDR